MAVWVVNSQTAANQANNGNGRRTNGSPYSNIGINSYVRNLTTGMYVKFNTVPDIISESISSVFNSQTINGRSDPLFYYSNSGPRNISFTLPIIDDYTPFGIVYTINQLKALAYPRYVGYVVEPPKCYLKIGNFLRLTGYLENINVDWQSSPTREGVYQYADVAFTFTQAVQLPFDAVQVEQGATS